MNKISDRLLSGMGFGMGMSTGFGGTGSKFAVKLQEESFVSQQRSKLSHGRIGGKTPITGCMLSKDYYC